MIQRLPIADVTTVPSANAVVELYDDKGSRNDAVAKNRFRGNLRCDQEFSINRYWAVSPTGPLRLILTTAYAGGSGGHILGTKAKTVITAVAVADLVDGDYFSISDGTTTKTYEFEVTEDFESTEGRAAIDVSDLTTAAEVATAIYEAIHADFPATLVMAEPTDETVTASAANTGTQLAVTTTEHVANAGFTTVDSAGTDGTVVEIEHHLRPGRNRLVCVIGSSAPSEFEYAAETSDEPYPT